MKRLASILILAVATSCVAQEPVPVPKNGGRVVPEKLAVSPGELYEVEATSKGEVIWDVPAGIKHKVKGKTLILVAPSEQSVIKVLSQDPFTLQSITIEIGIKPQPKPDPDAIGKVYLTKKEFDAYVAAQKALDSDQNAAINNLNTRVLALEQIKPIPPKPDPPIPPKPTPVKEGRVMIVFESSLGTPLLAGEVRAYLNAKCVKAANGQPEWRMYDKDTVITTDAAHWKTLLAQPRNALPYIYIMEGYVTSFEEGPLPPTTAETMALLRKYFEPVAMVVPMSRSGPAMPDGLTIAERVRWWNENYPEYASKP